MNTFNLTRETRFDVFFQKFTNFIMKDGKKLKASKHIFNALLILKNTLQKESKTQNHESDTHSTFTVLRVLFRAVENITPSVEVRKVRVSGSTHSVPAILSKKKQESRALKWLLESAQKRQKHSKAPFSKCLADEILDASRKMGQARQKRDELHRLAQMNRAFIRYRWW